MVVRSGGVFLPVLPEVFADSTVRSSDLHHPTPMLLVPADALETGRAAEARPVAGVHAFRAEPEIRPAIVEPVTVDMVHDLVVGRLEDRPMQEYELMPTVAGNLGPGIARVRPFVLIPRQVEPVGVLIVHEDRPLAVVKLSGFQWLEGHTKQQRGRILLLSRRYYRSLRASRSLRL